MSPEPPHIDFASLLGPREERARIPLTLVTIIALAAAIVVLAALLYVLLPREGEAGATAVGIELALGAIALASVALILRHEARHARIERALAAEAAFRRAVESSVATGLCAVDPRGVIRYVNRALCQMTGFDADALVGRVPPYPYWPPGQRAEHENRHRQMLSGLGAAGGYEIAVQRRDGTTLDVRVDVAPLIDDRGRHLGWMTSITDITLRKATEEAARRHQEKLQFTARVMTLGEMASSLAHELNQPLTAITNYSEGLLARLRVGEPPKDAVLDALERTSAQARRAGAIIRRIREFVKRSEPRRQPVPARRVVDDAVGFAELDASKRGIAIVTDVAHDLPPLDADPILIEQVLLNLLKNAIDAMEHAAVRRIDVQVRRLGGEPMAEFRIVDRGSGIDMERLDEVFQPFFSTKPEGMGMGLNICRSIVEFHRGRLAVEPNPEPAGGTIFRFTLPLASGSAVASVAPAAPETLEK